MAEKGKGRIRIREDQPYKKLGDLFGIFFEDINHAADGGLYAELVQNRSFEFDPVDNPVYNGLTAWKRFYDFPCHRSGVPAASGSGWWQDPNLCEW